MLDESTIIDLLRIDVWMDRLCRLVVVVGKQAERERERWKRRACYVQTSDQCGDVVLRQYPELIQDHTQYFHHMYPFNPCAYISSQ